MLLLQPAVAGLGFENELQFHYPPSYRDLTADLAASLGRDRPEVGPVVAQRLAFDATGDSLEILSNSTNLEDGAFVTVRLNASSTYRQASLNNQWVGVFAPFGVNTTEVVAIKYTLPTVDSGYSTSGVATLQFHLFNMRSDLELVFFKDCHVPPYYAKDRSIRNCVATLRVGPISFRDYNEPLRPAILRQKSNTAVTIAWTTRDSGLGAHVNVWQVDRKTRSPSGPVRSFTAVARAPYSAADLCDAPAKTYGYFDPGTRNLANVTDLAPGALYQYQLADSHGRHSEVFSFNVPTAPGRDATASLLVYADLGRGTIDQSLTWDDYGRPALNTSRRMTEDLDNGIGVDGIFHSGDISYAVGFEAVWDIYAGMMTPVLSRTAYSLNYGNHEADTPAEVTPQGRTVTLYNGTDSGGECGVPTNGWYPMPWKSIDEPWYSYDVGPVHVVAMGTEHDFRVGSLQYQWIEQDLASVDRTVTPWILFGGHRPMYIDSTWSGSWTSDNTVADLLVQNLEPLLLKYQVDVAVWGHNHVVQRMCKLANHECVEHSQGAQHVFTKGGGGVVHLVIGAAGASFSNNVNHPWLKTTEFSAYVYGHSRMTFVAGDKLTWEWIANDDGRVLANLQIVRTPSPPSDDGPSAGEIAGIVAGSVCGVGLISAALWFGFCRRRPLTEEKTPLTPPPGASIPGIASPFRRMGSHE
jgi:acid phosphatase type 7